MGTQTQFFNGALGAMYMTGDAGVSSWWELNAEQLARLADAVALWNDVSAFNGTMAVDDAGLAQRSLTWVNDSYWQNGLPNDWTRVAVGQITDSNTLGINQAWGEGNRYHEVYIDSDNEGVWSFQLGSTANAVLLHELAHSIFGDNSTHTTGELTQTVYAASMNANNSNFWYPSTPMTVDIDKIRNTFIGPTNTRTGDDTYGFNAQFTPGGYRAAFDFAVNTRPLVTIYDDGGTDKLDASGFRDAAGNARSVSLDLASGAASRMLDGGEQTFAVIYHASQVENGATGGGNDQLRGNALNNVLQAGGGNDVAWGFDGIDTLYGEGGNDTLDGGLGRDVLVGGSGDDTYYLTDINTSLFIRLSRYDTVSEDAGGGVDTVVVTALDKPETTYTDGYTLGANVEKGIIAGDIAFNLTGNELNNELTGNAAANSLTGGEGNDTLNGGGARDTLVGGNGDDTYHLTGLSRSSFYWWSYDAVVEEANGGTDWVVVTAADNPLTLSTTESYTLGANIEHGRIEGTLAFDLYGNELGNQLGGNGAANLISGEVGNDTLYGGSGLDTLNGGAGDDTYWLFDQAMTYGFLRSYDIVGEDAGGGTDTVLVSAMDNTFTAGTDGYTLRANVENGTLLGTTAFDLTGNELDNVLTGNAGANTLTSNEGQDTLNGGDGRDTLVGGAGDDTYLLTDLSRSTFSRFDFYDAVTEDAAGGTDTVVVTALDRLYVSDGYTLAANVENGIVAGRLAFSLTGNELDNILTGNLAANTLTGGEGRDSLNGVAGHDSLDGGHGDDVLNGGFQDHIESRGVDGHDVISGGLGNDTVIASYGNDTVDGGQGLDTLSFAWVSHDLVLSLAAGAASFVAGGGYSEALPDGTFSGGSWASINSVRWTGIENLTGGSGNDVLSGDGGANVLSGGAGRDALYGLGGDDVLIGGATSGGVNQLWGGEGSDTASYEGAAGAVSVDLRAQAGRVAGALVDAMNSIENATGGSHGDVLIGSNLANALHGGAGADALYGLDGADALQGGGGNDQLWGGGGFDWADYSDQSLGVRINLAAQTGTGAGAGVDTFNSIENARGGAGTDTVFGSAIANLIEGGGGRDILYGMGGADVFVYRAASDSRLSTGYDSIGDFVTGVDKLDLSAFGIGAANVVISSVASSTALYADVDAAAAGFELAISFVGANALATSDILF